MGTESKRHESASVSVVIPAYNSADWLPSTIEHLVEALSRTSWVTEIIVIDDGSTDSTQSVLAGLVPKVPVPLRVISTTNQGVYLAVWEGIQASAGKYVFVVNSRLLVHAMSLSYLETEMQANPGVLAWNGHVITDPDTPLVGRFWEVPTYLFWGDYLSHPRQTLIGPDNFDKVPKGTGCFLVEKTLFRRAYEESWPDENAHLTSDDTKLLRFIALESPIRLDPEFSATYRPRTTFAKFLRHAKVRGTLFVDSYAGTTRARSVILVALVLAPIVILALLVIFALQANWVVLVAIIAALVLALAVPIPIAGLRRCPPRALVSYAAYAVPFGIVFWLGLAKGVVVHRAAFSRPAPSQGRADG